MSSLVTPQVMFCGRHSTAMASLIARTARRSLSAIPPRARSHGKNGTGTANHTGTMAQQRSRTIRTRAVSRRKCGGAMECNTARMARRLLLSPGGRGPRSKATPLVASAAIRARSAATRTGERSATAILFSAKAEPKPNTTTRKSADVPNLPLILGALSTRTINSAREGPEPFRRRSWKRPDSGRSPAGHRSRHARRRPHRRQNARPPR
jgi:hypothetical protein